MSDMGYSRRIADEDEANERACDETAKKNGHTSQQAEDCDDGSVNCPDCPFKGLQQGKNANNLEFGK